MRMRLFGRWEDRPHFLPSPHPPCPSPGSPSVGRGPSPSSFQVRGLRGGRGARSGLPSAQTAAASPTRERPPPRGFRSLPGLGGGRRWANLGSLLLPWSGSLGLRATDFLGRRSWPGRPAVRAPGAHAAAAGEDAARRAGRGAGGLQVCARHSWILPSPFPRTALRFCGSGGAAAPNLQGCSVPCLPNTPWLSW